MAFDQSTITDIGWYGLDGDTWVRWSSSAPAGTTFQVYVNRRFAWYGQGRQCVVPPTPTGQPIAIAIGTVAAGEEVTDFSSSLPSLPGGGNRVAISWIGGTYESVYISGFNIYMGTTPGGAVNYTTPVGVVTAYPGDIVSDGFGQGGFGLGGFGQSSAAYSWTSNPVTPGVWNVAVKPFDIAGNEGSATTGSVTIAGPPNPVARFSDGKRLHAVLTAGKGVLTWNASP